MTTKSEPGEIVRAAEPADYPEMGRILWEAFGSKLRAFAGDQHPRGERLLADLFALGALRGESARVVRDRGGPVGVCVLRLPDVPYGSAWGTARVALRHSGLWRAPWVFTGLCLFDEPARAGQATIALLAVAPEARGRGIGGALLRAAEEEARRRGLARLALDVIENNPAKNLYLRHGFRTTRTTRLPAIFGRLLGYECYDHMEKPLD